MKTMMVLFLMVLMVGCGGEENREEPDLPSSFTCHTNLGPASCSYWEHDDGLDFYTCYDSQSAFTCASDGTSTLYCADCSISPCDEFICKA